MFLTIMQPSQTGRVRGDGVELKYGYWHGGGSPVIALHGLTASHINFIGVAERLAGRRALFAPDLRGRGDSDKPAEPYGMGQHARDVACAMRAMGFGPSVIAGHSMGAFVAAALAEQNPELVSALVLIDGGYAPAITGVDPVQALGAMLAVRIEQLRKTYPSRDFYRDFWRSQPHFAAEWNPWVEAFLDYELGGDPPELRPKASIDAVKADLAEGFKSEEIARRLRGVRVPVVLFRAERGFVPEQPPLFPDGIVPAIRELVPQLEDRFIPGTTHYTIVLGEQGAGRIAECLSAPA